MRISIDFDLCQGHSVCLEECPEVFDVVENDEGYPKVVLRVENPDESLRSKVELAARYCPNHCITVEG